MWTFVIDHFKILKLLILWHCKNVNEHLKQTPEAPKWEDSERRWRGRLRKNGPETSGPETSEPFDSLWLSGSSIAKPEPTRWSQEPIMIIRTYLYEPRAWEEFGMAQQAGTVVSNFFRTSFSSKSTQIRTCFYYHFLEQFKMFGKTLLENCADLWNYKYAQNDKRGRKICEFYIEQ